MVERIIWSITETWTDGADCASVKVICAKADRSLMVARLTALIGSMGIAATQPYPHVEFEEPK